MVDSTRVTPVLEPIDISVKLQSSNTRSYFGQDYVNMLPPQSESVKSNAHKRTSLNHYMIESSITEEVREENISEKTSSERNSECPKRKILERDDHIILQEGETSMF